MKRGFQFSLHGVIFSRDSQIKQFRKYHWKLHKPENTLVAIQLDKVLYCFTLARFTSRLETFSIPLSDTLIVSIRHSGNGLKVFTILTRVRIIWIAWAFTSSVLQCSVPNPLKSVDSRVSPCSSC
ncbi:unnamed protein product [Albugo candida]|uniref:Uncharacterized protein n=1 Tax=Albugo candida TaxID=65357 RepID=A0A024GC84_9STRA|nr:unnamed protein product [Albugo candida]|eukprot:CCI44160.1 unnamed protein product [Albugo candida]